MEDQEISTKVAKAAKLKGFYIKGTNSFNTKDKNNDLHSIYLGQDIDESYDDYTKRLEDAFYKTGVPSFGYTAKDLFISATQTAFAKWLRTTHNIYVELNIILSGSFAYGIYKLKEDGGIANILFFATEQHSEKNYEKALDKAFLKALTYIKINKDESNI